MSPIVRVKLALDATTLRTFRFLTGAQPFDMPVEDRLAALALSLG
jgi:hypothetical protein